MAKADRIKTIFHNGKTITYITYNGLSKEEEDVFIETINAATQYIINKGGKQLQLVNVENAYGSTAIFKKFKEDSVLARPYLAKQAVVGITGAKAILLKGINLFAKVAIVPFDTEDEAKEWLTAD